MNATTPDDEYGVPDEESPELTDDFFLWAVRAQDFGGDHMASHAFLVSREAFFRSAEAAGMTRESFLPFAPTKPGFFERATAALEAVLDAMKHADQAKHAAE